MSRPKQLPFFQFFCLKKLKLPLFFASSKSHFVFQRRFYHALKSSRKRRTVFCASGKLETARSGKNTKATDKQSSTMFSLFLLKFNVTFLSLWKITKSCQKSPAIKKFSSFVSNQDCLLWYHRLSASPRLHIWDGFVWKRYWLSFYFPLWQGGSINHSQLLPLRSDQNYQKTSNLR